MRYALDWMRYIVCLLINAVFALVIFPAFVAVRFGLTTLLDGFIELRDQAKYERPRKGK